MLFLLSLFSTLLVRFCLASQLPLPMISTPLGSSEIVSPGEPTIHDLINIHSRASIFADYLRSVSLGARLNDRNTLNTVLVPTNKAVLALARKPHQGPPKTEHGIGEIEISEEEQDRKSTRNVENWISAHIIPQHPISLSSGEAYATLLEGTTINFIGARDAQGDWEHYVMDPDVKIVEKIEGVNGVAYMIEGTVTF